MAISKRVRFEVFKRDRFTCQYCGLRPPDVMLEIDHIVPRCEGGSDDPSNLTTSCLPCSRGKAGIPLGDVAPAIDELEIAAGIQEMLERASALRSSMVVAEAHRRAEDDVIGRLRTWWEEENGNDHYVEDRSLRTFLKRLPVEDIRDAIEQAASYSRDRRLPLIDTWKYFCGICWTMIRQRDAE